MVLLEAMAMGLPVVATDIAGVRDTISDGVDGRLVPVTDIPALTAAIKSILADRDAARRLGRKARKRIERDFTVERMVQRTEVLYDELLAQKGLLM